jgi:3-oxoacyl-[acyl-carrier protein] reductase
MTPPEAWAPVAVITGASRGIGRAIALEFARGGWHVVVNFRRERAEAQITAAAITDRGGSVALRQADIAAPGEAARLFAGLPRVDVLVNNAGITRDGPLATMPRSDFDAVLATNLGGVFHCARAAAPLMCAAGRGVIINIGSSAAASARAGQANYAAAKSGLIGFTRSLARELAPSGVRVVGLAPGYTVTDMARAVPDAAAAEALRRIPLARWARPEEVSGAVAFLASAAAAGFTGQTILLDGGRTAFETELGL